MDGISPVGWLCLLPPLLTIALAIITRRVVPALLLGICCAVILLLPSPKAYALTLAEGAAFSWIGYLSDSMRQFTVALAEERLWASLTDADHLRVFAFTSILGIQVALIHRCGGMQGIVNWARSFARSRRGGQVLTGALGLVIFIDDYANTLLLGSTMRPITDRLRISREKLAFLVDSTAAPVSGLALVSTWVATEISTMRDGYRDAGIDIGNSTFSIFIQTIPSRFYILYALAFVLFCALTCRDFGPMLTAERRALRSEPPADADPSTGQSGRAINALLPILVTVAVVVWLLITTGLSAVGDSPLPDQWLQRWGEIVGQGNSYVALVYGALAGLAVVLLLATTGRLLSTREIRSAALDGFTHVLPAMLILWLAWTLSSLTGKEALGTGDFLAAKVSDLAVSAGWMPTIIFLLASGIAFSTGTSWGTMAILMPITIPLVHGLIAQQDVGLPPPDHYILVASIGSVLAGAIFGDHCSPISDTTILSSRSSDCDHIAHVRTQIPYALTIGLVAIFAGTLPAGFGVSCLITLPIGLAILLATLLLFGRDPRASMDC